MTISIQHECPRAIKWKNVRKFKDDGYFYPIIQVKEYDNRLWLKHTPSRNAATRKPFYVVVEDYLNRNYHEILNYAIDHELDARHFTDAVLGFYISKIRNMEI